MAARGTIVCPRGLEQFVESEVRYRNADREIVDKPRLYDVPALRNWSSAIWHGNPDKLLDFSPGRIAAHYASGVVRVCPQGHELPEAMCAPWPTFTIALVGETSAGKSLYLASLINELVFKEVLADAGLSFRLDDSCRDRFSDEFGETIDHAAVPIATTENSDFGVSREPYVLTVEQDGADVANLVIFDAAGSQLSTLRLQAARAPQLVIADAALFFVPPAAIARIATAERGDQRQTPTRTGTMIQNALQLMEPGRRAGRAKVGVMVVSKADDIPDAAVGSLPGHKEQPDYADLDDALDRGAADSALVSQFLRVQGAGSIVRRLEEWFESVSFHMVSCVDGAVVEGRFLHGLEPRRVPDPLLFVLDAFGVLDSGRASWREVFRGAR